MTTPTTRIECPNCHDANKYGDYEGPTCEVCKGDGWIAPPTLADHSTMLERIAQGMYASEYSTEDYPWEDELGDSKLAYYRLARAALQALHTPTPAMEREGFFANHWQHPTDPAICVNISAMDAWQAMIDAALNEKAPGDGGIHD